MLPPPEQLVASFSPTSLVIEGKNGYEDEFAVALISADLPGIEIEPFWGAGVLGGAQSEAVILSDVAVEEDLVITMGSADAIERKRPQWSGVPL